jgi:hypothetical protein
MREKRRQTSHNIIPQRFISLAPFSKAVPVVALFLVWSHLREAFRFREWIGKRTAEYLREFFKSHPKIPTSRFRVFRFEFVDSNQALARSWAPFDCESASDLTLAHLCSISQTFTVQASARFRFASSHRMIVDLFLSSASATIQTALLAPTVFTRIAYASQPTNGGCQNNSV